MGDASQDGWQTVLPTSHYGVERLSRAQLEAYERQNLKDWENSRGHWSGVGKHTSSSDFTEAKKLHTRFRPAVDSVLGSGTYGLVEKVTYTHNNRSICLARKWIQYRRGRTIQMLREEANVMEKLDHEHIVKLVGTYCVRHNELYLLLWPVAVCNLDSLFNDLDALRTGHGDRDDILKRLEALEVADIGALERNRRQAMQSKSNTTSRRNCPLQYLRQIIGCATNAVAYCHEANIRHLDLKPSNILLSPGRVYLADFGIARDVNDRDHTMTFGVQGTPKWRAPEICDPDDEWSMKAADVYSLGLVLLNMATILYGADLADFDRVVDELNACARAEKLKQHCTKLEAMALATQDFRDVKAHTFAPKHIVELASRMLSSDPSRRPNASQVDAELVELGGIEQIYHLPCCKRSSRFVTERMDLRYKAVVYERDRLLSETQKMAKRLAVLEGKDETYEDRLKNERKAHALNIAHLQEQLDKERKERSRLQAQLTERRQRPGLPRPQRSISGGNGAAQGPGLPARPQTHPLPGAAPSASMSSASIPQAQRKSSWACAPLKVQPHSYSQAAGGKGALPSMAHRPESASLPNEQTTSARSVIATASGIPSPSPTPSPKPNLSGFALRSRGSGSRLPRLVNPSTPIRSNTPSLQRDPSLTDSTQFSMASSTFSHLSRQSRDSASAVGSPAVGSVTPGKDQKDPDNHTSVDTGPEQGVQARKDVGLGLSMAVGLDRTATDKESIGDHASMISSGAPGTTSPVLTASALSSPRSTKAELHPNVTVGRVPPLPTAKSWADVARR